MPSKDLTARRNPAIAGCTATGVLKILALVFMFIDHAGKMLFPQIAEMRMLGRIAFPLYCWCMVVGISYTRSVPKYLGRLMLIGLVSQPIYMVALNHSWNQPNIFLTLLVALCGVWGLKAKKLLSHIWAPILALFAAQLLGCDYGWRGVMLVMLLFVGILWRDVNRSNRYKRQLEAANRHNEALLEAREKLMLTITHDIKAPLGSIMGYIDLLTRLDLGKRGALYLDHMKSSADHLLELVTDLLDFYKLDSNKVAVNRIAFSPADLFTAVCTGFEPVAAAKGIELRCTLAAELSGQVAGDPSRVRQIAENLLSNAIKFTDRGFVAFDAWLEEGRLLFRVSDTGRGIGPEERERIFQEFVRLPSAGGVSGVGLGLSIVDRLVKLLGGTIELESEPGPGKPIPGRRSGRGGGGRRFRKGSRSGDVFGQSVYGGRTTPPLPAGG